MAPCCVSGCSNRGEQRSKRNSGVSYHLFPRDIVKRKRWVEAIGRSNWQPSNVTVVCSDHFDNTSFYLTQYGLKRLVEDAVPVVDTNKAIPSASDDLLSQLETILQNKPIEDAVTEVIKNSLIEDMPEITQNDSQKVKDLAAQYLRLTIIYEKQKKKIRNLRQKVRRQETKLENLGNPADLEQKAPKAKKKKKKDKRDKKSLSEIDNSKTSSVVMCEIDNTVADESVDPLYL